MRTAQGLQAVFIQKSAKSLSKPFQSQAATVQGKPIQLMGFKCTWLTGWVWVSER